jgi:hypothetical protein
VPPEAPRQLGDAALSRPLGCSALSQPRRFILIHHVVLSQPDQLLRRAEELNDDLVIALGAFQRDVAGDNVGQDCQSRSFATGSRDAHSRHHPLRFSLDGVGTRFQIRGQCPVIGPVFVECQNPF